MSEPLRVCERFYSLQGESTRAGLPCLFIRLSGCNLRCRYCDAAYTWEEAGTLEDQALLLHWMGLYPGVMVEITGGEPLLQEGVVSLLARLDAAGREVLLETNGSIDLGRVPLSTGIIMDIKCPDSGMAGHLHPSNLACLRQRALQGSRDEVKFVLNSIDDFHWARDLVLAEELTALLPVLFSPVTTNLPAAKLADLLLTTGLGVRLQLQLHTLLWPEKNRGV